MNPRFSILVIGIGMLSSIGIPTGQCAAQPSEQAAKLVDLLDAPAWSERDRAMNELETAIGEVSIEDLEFFLEDATLTLEQRTRLIDAITTRFSREPKGGLGVAFGAIRVGAIEVVPIDQNPNFPATLLLNPGDAIAMVGETLMTSSFDLRAQILSRAPGEVLPAMVIRDNKMIRLDLPLGSYRDLAGAAFLEPDLARRSLELRWARKGIVLPGPSSEPIGLSIDTDQWQNAAFPEGIAPASTSPSNRVPSVVMGGLNQLIPPRLYSSRPTNRTWKSSKMIQERLVEIQIQQVLLSIQTTRAKEAMLNDQIKQLRARIEQTNEPEELARLRRSLKATTSQWSGVVTLIVDMDKQVNTLRSSLKSFEVQRP
jgi:hypothetical protein